MDTLTWLLTGSSVAFTILTMACTGILTTAIIGGVGYWIYNNNKKRLAYREAAQNWTSTTGTILMSSVERRKSGGRNSGYHDYAVIVYQFQVNGQTYQSQTVKAGEQFLNINVSGQAQATVNKYLIGKQVTVYYDPNDPAQCALER